VFGTEGQVKRLGPTCKEVALLLSVERSKSWRVWYHLAICRFCRAYLKNLDTVSRLVKTLAQVAPEDEAMGEKLVSLTKEKLKVRE
jgi:predicted anti-sigma-YlaC factor YlaD